MPANVVREGKDDLTYEDTVTCNEVTGTIDKRLFYVLSNTLVTICVPLPIPVEQLPNSEGPSSDVDLNSSLSIVRIHLTKGRHG